jgi:hypothetical protein
MTGSRRYFCDCVLLHCCGNCSFVAGGGGDVLVSLVLFNPLCRILVLGHPKALFAETEQEHMQRDFSHYISNEPHHCNQNNAKNTKKKSKSWSSKDTKRRIIPSVEKTRNNISWYLAVMSYQGLYV